MRINKYWVLSDRITPFRDTYWPATKEIFDSVCIIHYPSIRNFRPIVLTEYSVKSGDNWGVASFYRGVTELLENCFTGVEYNGYYLPIFNGYKWGCRRFTKAQLKLIKKEMECFYSKKQLGVK